MTRVFAAAVTALFLGAVITEIHSRLFAGQYFPMLVLAVLAIFVGGLVTTRITLRSDTGQTAAAEIVANADLDDDRETGQVKWFNRTKGFGFIIRDSGGEVFVHHRNIRGSGRRSLKDGEYVRFRVASHDKGLQAEEVSVTRAP